MRLSTSIMFLSALLLLGCGGASESPEPADVSPAVATDSSAPPALALPSAADAAKIIGDSAEWSDYQFTYSSWSFQLGTPIAHPTTRQLADDLAVAGWFRVTPDGMIELTEKARSDKRFLVRSNNSLDIVPMAKKEVVGVTTVSANPDGTARAEVEWKWVANEVGASFRSGFIKERYEAPQVAIATLESSGGGWKVRDVEPVK